MHRFSIQLFCSLAAFLPGLSVTADDLMPPHVAARLGLTEAWMRPINAPFGAQSVADQQLFVHQTDPHEYIEIVAPAAETATQSAKPESSETATGKSESADTTLPTVRRVLARIEIGRMGKATPEANRAEAERLTSNEVRRLKRYGIEATIENIQVPRVHIYSIATNGALESRNAETGEVLWTRRVGDPRLPYRSIGVDDKFLSIVNGSYVIQLDVTNGEELHKVRTRGTPMFGAVNSGDFALIPMVGGNVEGYPLADPTRDPFLRSSAGSSLAMPTKSPDSSLIAWGTDAGYVFVAETSGKAAILFRLNTDGIVSSRLAAASGDRFFFGSENGQVYGLRATRTGEVLWSQPFGEPFYNQPIVVGKQVLISSTYGNLVSFDAETGLPSWNQSISNIDKVIAAFDGRLYATTLSGTLAVIEIDSGNIIDTVNEIRPQHILVNSQSDRMYLLSERGNMQCLRPLNTELPTFVSAPDVSTTEPEPKPTTSEPETTKSPFEVGGEEPMGDEPFDPFAPAPGGDDADPFGGDAGFGGEDPFGE